MGMYSLRLISGRKDSWSHVGSSPTIPTIYMKFFKITGRDMRAQKPKGIIITFWLGAESKEKALKMCEEKGIMEIESIEDDTGSHPWAKEM